MKYLSICSGIEAATVAWHPLGWEAVAFAEIEKFPGAVLKHHWPDVPNLGDMTRFREWPESVFLEADCIIAGTPCQAFSVAGQRRSLEDERGNLTLTFTQIIDHARTIRIAAGRPEAIILWENVPGCLSTKDNAFGCFLSELSGEDVTAIKKWPAAGRVLGEKRRVAWRIIDAQYAGVPQRRRRVFCVSVNAQAVADSRTASPEEILFIGQSLRGNLEKSKEEEPAGAVAAGSGGGAKGRRWPKPLADCLCGGYGKDRGLDDNHIKAGGGHFVQETEPTWWDGGNTTAALTTKSDDQRMPDKGNLGALVEPVCLGSDQANAAIAKGKAPSLSCNRGSTPIIGFSSNMSEPDAVEERTPPQKRAGGNAPAVAFTTSEQSNKMGWERDIYSTLQAINQSDTSNIQKGIRINQTVRRLTPVECERLQGFPDNHTRIPWRGKPADQCPDGSRYKALGNSMAVPVIRWLGQRIQAGMGLKNL